MCKAFEETRREGEYKHITLSTKAASTRADKMVCVHVLLCG